MLIWKMKNRKLYLSIGSNLYNRKSNILLAIKKLEECLGPRERLSDFMETPSWGFVGADFLNVAVSFMTSLDAEEILKVCKSVERQMGRKNEGIELDEGGRRIYHDRIIDIDIILLGEEKIDTPTLKIPHPRMWDRDFVIKPLKEIFDGELMGGND